MVKRLPRVEIKMAVMAVISKRSKGRDRTIAAASLREIKNDLKKNYLKDVTERQVLNVIRDLGKIVVKERDPRDRRRTLYRINPNVVEEAILTLIKLDDEKAYGHDGYEGILYDPPPSPEKAKFLAIDDVNRPAGVNVNEEFGVDVKVSYCFMKPTRIFLGVVQEESPRWLATITEILSGEGIKTYTLRTRLSKLGDCKLRVNAYYLEGMRWRRADSIMSAVSVEEEHARILAMAGGRAIQRQGEWTKEYYKLLVEFEDKTEMNAVKAYGHATIDGWLSGSPSLPAGYSTSF
ncbi:MAG: hypothetical protein ACE5L6_07960 [Candidatus Bathyarchaeia archaeon]